MQLRVKVRKKLRVYCFIYFKYCYNNCVGISKMLNQDSQQGEMPYKCYEKASQCSTNVSFCPYYEQQFYLGAEETPENLVRIQLSQQKIVYYQKRNKKTILLSLTRMEEFIYLRDQKTVFAIKLTRNHQQITFSTFQKQRFISLYLNLAKNCILTGFQKHYRVGNQLGNGCFSQVYNGYNLLSNQNVALKVISKSRIQQVQNGLQMLHNQMIILEKLKNFQISPLISTYETVDCFILVLEKGQGGNLLDYIQTHENNYCESMLKQILKQVLQNISLIHEAGFIHRDIKPENIICKDSANPSVFLCDYGISIKNNYMNFDQKQAQMCGTLGYIAPQIINEEHFDQKCDIFSLGCVFYYMFTGNKLFDTKNFFQLKLMMNDSNFIAKRLKKLNHLDIQVRNLLQRMLELNPQQRFSANEALRHGYFKDSDTFIPNLGEYDYTLRDFIQNKISHYWY